MINYAHLTKLPIIALSMAAKEGDYQSVVKMLEDPLLDPSGDQNMPIYSAASHGHLDIVELLLTDPRVDPQGALSIASEKGHAKVVERLLKDPRTEPSANDNLLLREVIQTGRFLEIIKLLLNHPSVEQAVYSDRISDLVEKCHQSDIWRFLTGYRKMNELFLSAVRGDNEVFNYWSSKTLHHNPIPAWAGIEEYHQRAKQLLAHPLVTVQAQNKAAFNFAIEFKYDDLVELMTIHPTCNISIKKKAIEAAAFTGNIQRVKNLSLNITGTTQDEIIKNTQIIEEAKRKIQQAIKNIADGDIIIPESSNAVLYSYSSIGLKKENEVSKEFETANEKLDIAANNKNKLQFNS
ncbi:ankyrin repeat domain-containing protein [Candidatus Berkiella aquae]|uniref:Ankyrin repeat domain-containing protein n=1 Tax=Candidatus Berkiella aquae TaxID=295108 RepID=A0A0Q9YMB3_9GAMM|nr:ankyrin repeat domain-containing protein [Candidatus Berkiella aquae]MCS5710672.1 ankyrin repeat domain-containing protein [Candidatus Berkiella aquae]